MKRIGILGGSSDQATADYYRRLNKAVNQQLGGWNTAELILSSMNFAFSVDCIRNERWDDLGDYLAQRAQALERAGADILICVSNTLHRVCQRFTRDVAIPFLHIADPTGQAIVGRGLTRVGLLGTKSVMATDALKSHFDRHFGIEIAVPEPHEQDVVDRIIFEELCRGEFSSASARVYLEIIDRLQIAGAQGVILGCTEIPLLIRQEQRPLLPMFDTTGLHVDAVVKIALASADVD